MLIDTTCSANGDTIPAAEGDPFPWLTVEEIRQRRRIEGQLRSVARRLVTYEVAWYGEGDDDYALSDRITLAVYRFLWAAIEEYRSTQRLERVELKL